jgi:DNA-binding MarR family transcriptional regulator
MAWCPNGNVLDQDIFDALAEFFAHVLERGDQLASEFGVPTFCIKALHRLDESVTLKELGKRLHVDPSFVTMIADMLEERGLARREPNAADRRIKNLVLTPEGLALKARVEAALLDQMPWARALDVPQQQSLLAMIRRMNGVLAGMHERGGEVSDAPIAGLPGEAGRAAELTPNPA